jgi:hypothetical protein
MHFLEVTDFRSLFEHDEGHLDLMAMLDEMLTS